MDIIGIIGFVAALILMVFGIVFNMTEGILWGNLAYFVDIPSVVITIGGTFAVLMMSYTGEQFAKIPKHLKICFFPTKYDPVQYIEKICEFAKEARVKGLLSLENNLAEVTDDFLRRSLMLVVDSVDSEKVKSILDTELDFIDERHGTDIGFYNKGASFGPAFGMIGTLIGLVNMLQVMDDPSQIGTAMAVALLTTLYGSFLANVLFLPIAFKLKLRHDEEMLCKTVIAEGVKAIQAGENPRFIEEKLMLLVESGKRHSSGDGETEKSKKKKKK